MSQPRLKSKTQSSDTTASFFFFFLFLWQCVLSNNNHHNQLEGEEAAYLLKLRDAISPAPPHWFNVTNMCEWTPHVTCNPVGEIRNVTEINLVGMSLKGQVPPGLNNSFPSLTILNLYNNSLTGPLPSLAGLRNLEKVYLNRNNFTSVPHYDSFQGLVRLQFLFLGPNTNLAPWSFPSTLSASSDLKVLTLTASNLMGSLPDTFASFPDLRVLKVSGNNLTGGLLPNSIRRLLKLQQLDLSDQNHRDGGFSGTIEFLSLMTQLNYVNLERNSFQGPIPDLSSCTNLTQLFLQDNKLTGEVPPSLMNLSKLKSVSLDRNLLQGPMPAFNVNVSATLEGNGFCLNQPGLHCDHRVTTLLQVAAAFGYPFQLARTWRGNNPCTGWNFITCDVQGKIRTVNLTKLNLTGTISPAFASLTDLQELYLSWNNLSGSLPGILTSLSQLKILDVSNNNLSGIIPRFSSNIALNVSHNGFRISHSPSRTTLLLIKLGAGVVGSIVGVIVIFEVIVFNRVRRLSLLHKIILRRKRKQPDHYVENLIKSYDSLTLKRYSYKEVKEMTNSFHKKLGEGGYGIVYKANLADGQQVAVKILKESKGSVEEFIDEVFIISRTSHVSIVSLLGFCYEKNKRALVYEFMHNDSLEKFICRKESSNIVCSLDWNTLYQISIGVARGLEYLHHGCNTRILHLDIKPQNILLDENFCPKVADFGLAKICKKDQSIVSILGTRGTPGYIAPEVFSRSYGRVSHKSDVYSYGMLILEMIGGRHNYEIGESNNSSEICFPDLIYNDLEQGNIPGRFFLLQEEEKDMVMKMILVSLWCIQPNPLDRPSINKVIEMLEGPIESLPYPPKPNLFSPDRGLISKYSNISSSNELEISLTTIEEIDSEKM
ncbi:hypothetical protein PIB30_077833 [Stylosanthes scabra]|uniref:Protein kinase domain-containing protein n=1 Tax=Stylosanthes scabra TaxID=79078 RepID=A0ABU6ZPE6_9FABA|nr:hypothetical protein [Stylosanthes scabra]